MPEQNPPHTTLVVRRMLPAPAAAVYRAWTDPAMVTQWSWGSEHESLSLEIDCRAGGSWKQEIRNRNSGDRWSFDGQFQEVVPGRRLVHTFFWRSDKGIAEGPSLVAIDFLAVAPDQTEVVITHSRLAMTSEGGTRSGWDDILGVIARLAGAADKASATTR
jgi:uncharacterized protein YndB with AHSA1/START domain